MEQTPHSNWGGRSEAITMCHQHIKLSTDYIYITKLSWTVHWIIKTFTLPCNLVLRETICYWTAPETPRFIYLFSKHELSNWLKIKHQSCHSMVIFCKGEPYALPHYIYCQKIRFLLAPLTDLWFFLRFYGELHNGGALRKDYKRNH